MHSFFKSVIDTDRSAIVICNTEHTVIYMNPAAIQRYSKRGGESLVGKSLLDCHNEESNEIIKRVVAWFSKSTDNNMIYTYKNVAENMDVYMVALRNANGELIGYYEKHEYRAFETAKTYDFAESLI